MSSEQLVDAYLRGEISRRAFIRGLVAAGVSLGAATAYSYLVPQRARAAGGSYSLSDEPQKSGANPPPPAPKPNRATSRSGPAITLQASRRRRRVGATVSSDEVADFVVSAVAKSDTLATKSFTLASAGARKLKLRLPRGAPHRLDVVARATDDAGQSSTAPTKLGRAVQQRITARVLFIFVPQSGTAGRAGGSMKSRKGPRP